MPAFAVLSCSLLIFWPDGKRFVTAKPAFPLRNRFAEEISPGAGAAAPKIGA